MSAVATIVGIAGPVLAGAGAAWSGSRFVQEGQRGFKTRFGRVVRDRKTKQPKLINPGFCFVIPKIDALYRTHVRDRTIAFDGQRIMLKDHTVFAVNAIILLSVKDTTEGVYNAIFTIHDFEGSIADFCSAALRDVVQQCDYTDLTDPENIAEQVRAIIEPQLTKWGAIVKEFRLSDCSPIDGSAAALLKKQTAIFNAEALREAVDSLGMNVATIDPSLAAALIGLPVAVNVNAGTGASTGSSHAAGS